MPVSQVNVNNIEGIDANGNPVPVTVSYGASVPSGQGFTAQGNVNIVGVVTASNFVGNGSGLTGLTLASQGVALGIKRLLGYDEYRA